MRASLTVLLVASTLAMPAPAFGSGPGSLDRSFGTDGTVVTPIGAVDSFGEGARATAVVATPDGRLVVAGEALDGSGRPAFALTRYRADVSRAGGRPAVRVRATNEHAPTAQRRVRLIARRHRT